MKSLLSFILGVIITLFVCYVSIEQPQTQVKEIIKWKTATIKNPVKVDTSYKKHPIIKKKGNKPTILRDTVFVHDTLKIATKKPYSVDSSRIVKTRFSFRPKEFLMFTDCYAPDKVDSVRYIYKMRSSYIDSLRKAGIKEYPTWKKVAYFVGGALFTGTIFYLVK